MSDINASVVDKIRKLLALSQSPNEAEAASAMQKAHELLKAHNLSMADIGTDKRAYSERYHPNSKNRLEGWKDLLMGVVAEGNYCARVTIRTRAGELYYEIFGKEENVAATVVMFEYLAETVRRISIAAKDIIPNYSYKEFRNAMVCRLGQRLEMIKAQEAAEGCTALVVVSADAQNAMREAHKQIREKSIKITATESARYGFQAADSVSLNKQVNA